MQSEKLAVVGRLAASIAHEINNPLESVTNLLYLAEPATSQRIKEYVRMPSGSCGASPHHQPDPSLPQAIDQPAGDHRGGAHR